MASLKDVKNQIGGVKKTSQITKAMNMVAAAKLRGAQQKMEDFRPYTEKFNRAMSNLSSGMNAAEFPLMETRTVKKVELVIISSDRGLCGSFNANIFKHATKMINSLEAEGKEVSLVCVGKKAAGAFRKSGKIRQAYTDIMSSFQMFNAREIAQEISANFLDGNVDEVQLVYSRFINVGRQVPGDDLLLPVRAVGDDSGQEAVSADYIYEPSTTEIMEVLLPLYLNVMVYHAMLEIGASEHAARMTAMDNATKACGDIVDQLTLVYNKARQSGITAELMDIVGGAEALNG